MHYLQCIVTNGFTDDLHIATANNYTDNFTVQSTSLLKLKDSSCPTHKDALLYRSAGVFSDDGNILKLWIPAQDNNGVWTVFYTQATKENGVWKVGDIHNSACTAYDNQKHTISLHTKTMDDITR